jgi:hypothetical protein
MKICNLNLILMKIKIVEKVYQSTKNHPHIIQIKKRINKIKLIKKIKMFL